LDENFLRGRFFQRWLVAGIKSSRVTRWLAGAGLALLLGAWSYSAPDFDRMLEGVVQRGGNPAGARFQSWRNLVVADGGGTELERLTRVNAFFNRHIAFEDDPIVWGQSDYWATLLETLGLGRGDCEDFVIAKYFTLQLLGLAPERLRLVYVRARTGTGDAASAQAHMVLAYYAQPDAEPLVLDNLISEIRPASRRPDLSPVFSFNKEGVFTGSPGKGDVRIGGVGRLSRWEDLLKRARAEGFE
jgi:predicted transglutaminase-like cysteine proteinase